MKIELCKIKDIDLSYIKQYYPREYDTYNINTTSNGARGEHYKLLNYIAHLFSNEILLDIGTREGISALALATSDNSIITYDINRIELPFKSDYINVEFKQLDINLETVNNLSRSPLMVLDIDPHDGSQEKIFFNTLRKINYNGIIILDDINLNEGMAGFWESVTENKYDITKYGHMSGTGLVDFSGKHEVVD